MGHGRGGGVSMAWNSRGSSRSCGDVLRGDIAYTRVPLTISRKERVCGMGWDARRAGQSITPAQVAHAWGRWRLRRRRWSWNRRRRRRSCTNSMSGARRGV